MRRPEDGLGDGHVQEVFPRFGDDLPLAVLVAGGQRVDGLRGFQLDGAVAGLDLRPEQVVAQRRRRGERGTVWVVLLELGQPVDKVVVAGGVGQVRAEQLRPRAHRPVGVLETAGDEAMLHLGHLCAHRDHQTVH